ncbi:hypothetical protein HanRHA438_Chr14g0636851 [Helianthus annuus]|uniref:Uncharacterized protein n=1 Tax=Helianthus annuus TaxID=4232 RepID=A0A9K3E617_HELAN|nr:hypothetical protein HanXRQr2_Chr14g0627101 [Helianthus annuus]KAJ0463163.1 hypothetical protein HanHA300_Chr14g0512121 [Helianthus annuus]KAJ0467024.1 hypothetical protein HanIR_Chr14g0678641 [Helianthus annuus]KAJ0484535.1 hypothetical protein HanHA89_Chr14g0545191 [Helianthus annuus]KAJ0655090.1 hypothetical protein HanLR1_Chr14g0514481 [Helianthus annuus]
MSSALTSIKWSKEIFNDLVKSFKFTVSWGVIYPQEGQTAAQALAGYITLFWDYFAEGNFRLPATKFVLEVLSYYRHDKPVYVEDDKIAALYVVAHKRENEKMSTVQKGADEETWYHHIVKNFALPKDADLNAQPSTDVGELMNLGVGPKSKKKKRGPVASTVSKKVDTSKVDILKEEKKKGTHLVSEPWCDYVVVSDTLEGLAPVAVKKPKPEPRDTAFITRKKIGKKGNLDASGECLLKFPPLSYYKITLLISFVEKPIPPVHQESSSAFNDDLPPSPPRVSINEKLEGIKTVEVEVKKTVEVEPEKTAEVEATDAGVTKPKSPEVVAQGPEKKNSSIEEEVPVITIPSTSVPASELPKDDVQENPVHVEQGFVIQDEEENSAIHLDETPGDYYYRTYSEKRASDIHAPVWKLKQGDTFLGWQVCHDWLQGIFSRAEIKFQEEQSHERKKKLPKKRRRLMC